MADEKQTYKSTFDYANRTPYQDLIQSRYLYQQPYDSLAPLQMYQNFQQTGLLPQSNTPSPGTPPVTPPTTTPDIPPQIAAWLGYDLNANGRLGSKERKAFKAADLTGFQDWKGLGGNSPVDQMTQQAAPNMTGGVAMGGK